MVDSQGKIIKITKIEIELATDTCFFWFTDSDESWVKEEFDRNSKTYNILKHLELALRVVNLGKDDD